MPAPKEKEQLTPWLKNHGYRWVLKSPTGAIVNVSDAIGQIEEDEQYDPFTITGVYYSENVQGTGHVWMGQHDDDTGEFSFCMHDPVSTEEKDSVILYTFGK